MDKEGQCHFSWIDSREAHQSDLEVMARHFCRALTYWYDEPRGTAFCLVEAPSTSSVREMHQEAHGHIPIIVIGVKFALDA